MDAGVHPAYSGMNSLPYYDDYDLSTVDVLLISHFHLDHAASLPYVMEHTNFKGRVFMTHPTKAIYRWLLGDFVRVSTAPDSQNSLYSEADLSSSFDRIETIDYHSTMEVNGIKFTAFHAGHVLGAAMYLVEIAGVKALFTGDYSREEDRHLNQAEVPPQTPDILITESTYGTGIHQQRLEKEARLTSLIHSTINKGGRCLLPVFALGRAQEILLILDEYWEAHPELEGVNIYYASVLARKCMAVFQTYVNMMNDSIRKKFRDSRTNPFHFKHIKSIKNLERFDDIGPCVMVAAPGMLQNGVSRDLLELWAPDPRNALILTGYSVEGTLAKSILNEPTEIVSARSPETRIPRRLSIDEIPFAAHVDFKQNSTFIDLINAKHVILVHGETNNMNRLKGALISKYNSRKGTDQEVRIYNPRNCDELQLHFKSTKIAKVMGEIAALTLIPAINTPQLTKDTNGTISPTISSEKALTTTNNKSNNNHHSEPSIMIPHNGQVVSGILVEKDFHLSLVQSSDLKEYTGITTSVVTERQTVIVNAGGSLIRYHLEQMFGNIEVLQDETDSIELKIMDAVKVVHEGNIATIEWIGNIMNDAIADAVLGLLLSVDSSPASVKLSSKSCGHGHDHDHDHDHDNKENDTKSNGKVTRNDRQPFIEKVNQVSAILKAQFGDSYTVASDRQTATIEIDGTKANISFEDFSVECKANALLQRIIHVLDRASYTVAPLAGITFHENDTTKDTTTTIKQIQGKEEYKSNSISTKDETK